MADLFEEMSVLNFVRDGYSDREIAAILNISRLDIDTFLSSITLERAENLVDNWDAIHATRIA